MDDANLKEYLVNNDDEFRKLAEEHRKFDRQLEAITSKPYLTDSDHIEETMLKKRKLYLKDRMHMLMARHKQEAAFG